MIAVILGITGSFAFKVTAAKHTSGSQNLYAVSTDGVHFSWESSPPENYSCQTAKGTCEITTSDATPSANTYPASYTVDQGVDKDSAYMPN